MTEKPPNKSFQPTINASTEFKRIEFSTLELCGFFGIYMWNIFILRFGVFGLRVTLEQISLIEYIKMNEESIGKSAVIDVHKNW